MQPETLLEKRIFEIMNLTPDSMSICEAIVRKCAYIAEIESIRGDGISTPEKEIKRYFGLE